MGERWFELEKWLSRFKLRRCHKLGKDPVVQGSVWLHGGGLIELGDGVVLDGRAAPIELHALPGGLLVLGDQVRIEGGASLEATQSLVVGARCRIGPYAKLMDSHFHQVQGAHRGPAGAAPVVLGEAVVVGARAVLLPGARIESGAQIRPGAVISRPFPAQRVKRAMASSA